MGRLFIVLLFLSLPNAHGGVCAVLVRAYDNFNTYLANGTRSLDPKSYAIFDKGYQEPGFKPSPEERAHLREMGVEKLFDQYQRKSHFVQGYNRWMAIYSRSKPATPHTVTPMQIKDSAVGLATIPRLLNRMRAYRIYEEVLKDSAYKIEEKEKKLLKRLGLTQDIEDFRNQPKPSPLEKDGLRKAWNKEITAILTEAGRIGWRVPYNFIRSTIPLPKFLLHRKIGAIYDKVAIDHTYRPSVKERAFLKKHNLEEDLERYRSDVQLHGKAFANLAWLRRIGEKSAYFLALLAMGMGNLFHDYISVDESADPKHPDGMSVEDGKIEIIFTSPGPHASIRIGGIVYNYGPFTIQRLTLDQYLDGKNVGFGHYVSGNHQRVELKLTKDEMYRLRDILEADVGRVYPLVFPYNDCISQINKAVAKATGITVPIIMDRSQAGTLSYYKSLKIRGSERVGKIYFAAQDGAFVQEKAKDTVANGLDTLYFLGHWKAMVPGTLLWDQFIGTYEVPDYEKD